ncbi:unnamed protein product, partial [Rotaria magnacalcarata]
QVKPSQMKSKSHVNVFKYRHGRTFDTTTISSIDWFNNELLDQFIQW